MQPKAKLVEELNWLTDKISTQVWTLNLGTLATTWSLLIATRGSEQFIKSSNAIPIMALCIVAMLCELGQYYAGYFNAKSILNRLGESEKFEYDEKAPLYILRHWLFYIKAALTLIAASWLLAALLAKII
jgi:hypothetical protein